MKDLFRKLGIPEAKQLRGRNPWPYYESGKQQLQGVAKTPVEYERAVRELARWLGV